jgi:alkylated DNA repair protein (DNA oxidative demethylase)
MIAPDFWLLRGHAKPEVLMPLIEKITNAAPFRHMTVPGGKKMSVAMTNCGRFGWTASKAGYAYSPVDPESHPEAPWPDMPTQFCELAQQVADTVGWLQFHPDACLINRYEAGASMGLHQDRDEVDLNQPIVSISLGASCQFMVGGEKRTNPVTSIALHSGDVLVWGGKSRLIFHGVRPVSRAEGTLRYNLTLRKAT